MPMHLKELTLTNIRQFDKRTFVFQHGFNLLVGENGAGKTTILRGLLAALGNAREMERRWSVEDTDVRISARVAKISAVVSSANCAVKNFQVWKTFLEPMKRSVHRGGRPLILFYSSSEAICSGMKSISTKMRQNVDKYSIRKSEEFLYFSEKDFSTRSPTSVVAERRFGNSGSVRNFVDKVLFSFSPDISKFYWRFEPYDCSIVLSEDAEEKLSLDLETQKQARAFAMRRFEEIFLKSKQPFEWPDQAKILIGPSDSDRKEDGWHLPNLRDIWEDMRISLDVKKLLLSCSLEVKLTPRIMIRRKIGTLGIDQLSDGEQRLFSLFVDIARQLSINNPGDDIGKSEAIVLIDEIDVHLHPKWQRLIVPALEDLFPNCQFIATTHSPFVIQAAHRHQITSIDAKSSTMALGGGNSIEDIAEEIQGVSVPQRSIRAERLSEAAKKYFTLLEKKRADPRYVSSEILRDAELSYREASEAFTSDPAVHALINVLMGGGAEQ